MAQKEYAFFHFAFEDTGGAQIGGQYPLYDRGHIAEIYDANFRGRVSNSGKASLIQLFDPATPGDIGGTTAAAGTFTDLTASGDVNFDSGTFFVDVSANRIGIGTTSPSSKLHIFGASISEGDVNDERRGTLYLQNVGGTPGDGNLGVGIGFSGIDTGRRRALITTFQDGADGDPTGLAFYIYGGAASGFDNVAKAVAIHASGGVVVGSPTGGDKGAGSINASAIHDDNVLLTDLVLDYAVDGAWDRDAYAAHPVNSLLQDWMLDPAQYAEAWRRDRHLPLMVSWRDEANRPALGQIVTRQTGELELHAVHIAKHEDRIAALEARAA